MRDVPMKQENGSVLLGVNDPRVAEIGIITVSAIDDRQSVLAAILTQEKLRRKHIAIVLPNPNKAFQRPNDFDALKKLRRELRAQLIFIAPSGPGPAEFARQRRFEVYSSLETYRQSLLLDDEGAASQSPAPVVVPRSSRSYGAARGAAPDVSDDDDVQESSALPSTLLGAGAGAAAGFAAGQVAAHGTNGQAVHENNDDDDVLPPLPNSPTTAHVPANANINGNSAGTHQEDDDDAGPGIINLPMPVRNTGKLNPPPARPTPAKRRTTGIIAAGAAGAAATAGAASAASTAAPVNTTRASGVASPPPPTRTTSGGRSGAGGPRRPTSTRFLWVVAIVMLIMALIVVCATAVHFQPGLMSFLGNTKG